MGGDTIVLFCGTPNCFRKEIAIADLVAEVSYFRRGCPKCERPIQFGEEKEPADIDRLSELGELNPDLYLTFSPEESVQDIGTLASRCTSFVVTARTIAMIANETEDGRVMVHSEAIESTEEMLQSYRNMIEELEKRMSDQTNSTIAGGDRLSPAFPKDPETARRHSRELLGGDSKSGRITEGGLLSKLGIIKVEEDDSAQIRFSKVIGERLLDIEMPSRGSVKAITVSKTNRFSDILVPKYYSKEDAESLAKLITKNAEGERKLMHRVLRMLSNLGHKPPHIGDLAVREIDLCKKGDPDALGYWLPVKIMPRDRGGGRSVSREKMEDILVDEWAVVDRKVVSGMSAAIGRMRELRLIFGVRDGRHIRFFINDVKEGGEIGKSLLRQWDDQQLRESDA